MTGEPVTFPAVARRAGVSVSLLYADPTSPPASPPPATANNRPAGGRAGSLPARSLITEQSLRADLANAKEQARQLHDEVTVLRDRLAHDLGANADLARGQDTNPLLAQLEQRAAQLEADNNRLRQRVTHLEASRYGSSPTPSTPPGRPTAN